jgi:mono/diheme cytochrome c family protein
MEFHLPFPFRIACALALLLHPAGAAQAAQAAQAEQAAQDGKAIYTRHCASCHGENGEGVPDEYEDPLHGERTLGSLTRYIDRYMPEEDPELLDADQSKRVAQYIMGAFYSPESRTGGHAEHKIAFARLTHRQYRESVADLIGSFGKIIKPGTGSGLKGGYFQSDGMNKKARHAFDREDARIEFDFGKNSPGAGISADQFSIGWAGSLLPQATGWHEFRIITPNGARLYLNGESQHGDGNHRDDSDGKRQQAFIDSWVSSGNQVRVAEGRIFLLGGRAYPLRFDFFKFKEKHGMVRLEWKQPRGVWQVLEAPFISPSGAAPVAVVATAFPPDDASEGYERGTGVSKDWHEAVTAASIETANLVVARLPALSGVNENDPARTERLKKFVTQLAGRAFRRPLDDDLRRRYVDAVFTEGIDPEQAVKRATILILQSPRFLYPEIGGTKDDFTVATRLALGAWDSLPDQKLLDAAAAGKLRNARQVAEQSRRMMADPRAKAKLAGFFERWLKLDAEADLMKDDGLFPGFDSSLVADLRRSLELFVAGVVWSDASDYRVLMNADFLWFNDRLASYYGVELPEGDGFRKASLNPEQRVGVVTHPYLLARLAHHRETSPILRGVFITRNVLGGILKPPPEAIAFQDGHFDRAMTTREKVVQMTKDTSCMTCHDTINPLGFSLEHFDAVGKFRLTDNARPVDPESDFENFDGATVRLRGPRDLAVQAIETPSARRGFIRQVFESVIKQNPRAYGPDTLALLDKKFTASGYHIRNLLIEIHTLAALEGIRQADPSES